MAKTLQDLEKDLVETEKNCVDHTFLKQAANFVRDAAKMQAPGGTTGYLRNSIHATVNSSGKTSSAHIGTNLEYAMYVEFGTGPKGASKHKGIAPGVNPAYRSSPWYVPEDKLDPDAISRYHWQKYVGKDGTVFYRMYGQAAQPYLYPAMKDNENEIVQIIENGLVGAIK